jgi:AcrR family transcriptional regulator
MMGGGGEAMPRVSTREEILSSAAQLFATVGYRGTSLQDIAASVGCSKATLLYHFATKEMILATLVTPPVRELATLCETVSGLPARAARDHAIEGFVDLVLNYRREVALIFHDLPNLYHAESFAGVKDLIDQLAVALAGGSTEAEARLRVDVIMAGIAIVAVDAFDRPGVDARAALIDVARHALVGGSSTIGKPRPAKASRPNPAKASPTNLARPSPPTPAKPSPRTPAKPSPRKK